MHRLTRHASFVRREATDEELRAWPDRHTPDATIRAGLLSNPMAHTNWRSLAHERLLARLPDRRAAVSTPSLEDLPWALDYLLFQRGCNVLAINGGDGTIHSAVNALLRVVSAASERARRPLALPTLLVLNGGGMNMIGRALDAPGTPEAGLAPFLTWTRLRRFGELPTRKLPLLRVTEPDGTSRHGFIWGSGLVLNALTMHERFGRGYTGLARFLFEVYRGQLFQTALWRQFGHLLDPPATPIHVDGVARHPWLAAVVSTVPLTLARGALVTLDTFARPGCLEGLLVRETAPRRILRLIPRLMRARPAAGVDRLSGATRLDALGPYTLDGERMVRVPADGSVRVDATTQVVRAVQLPR